MSLTKKDKQILARRLKTDEDREPTSCQHEQPCADCPWARTALRGWTGNNKPEQWIEMAHGEHVIDCHLTTNRQCAGAAIFRANVFKSPRNPIALQLDGDTQRVFASNEEFLKHHRRKS